MPASGLRIAFVNTLYPPHGGAGAEGTLRMLARQLAARGHDCTIVTLTPERRASVSEVDGIAVHYLPLANVYWPHGERRPRTLRPVFQALDAFNPVMGHRLARTLRALAPDVVNCHNLQGFSVAAWRACARLGIPVVQTLHDYYTACPRSAMWRVGRGNCAVPCPECRAFAAPRRALSHVPRAVTCVSHRVMRRLDAAGVFAGARERGQIVRIIRGNNAEAALPPLQPARPGGPLRLGFMGRLDPSKGVEILLDAMALLPPGTATLRIAGRGPAAYQQALRARAGAGVQFLGHVPPAAFFPETDLLVIPSVWEDPFPRVFHEALAYGVPSLTTPLGGLPEVIEPGRTGLVAAAADAGSLHRSLVGVLADRHGLAAMQAPCRAAAAAYAPDRIVAEYEAVLLAAAGRATLPEDAGEAWPAPPLAAVARAPMLAPAVPHGA